MKVILQATGYAPQEVEYVAVFNALEEAGKRAVEVTFYRRPGNDYVAVAEYLTEWEGERNFTHAHFGDDAQGAASWVRQMAHQILPPGAGYPATPPYEGRQARLIGQLQTLTLVALSQVLADIGQE